MSYSDRTSRGRRHGDELELELTNGGRRKERAGQRRGREMERRGRRSGRLSRAYPSHQVGGEARQAGGVAPLAMNRGELLLCLVAGGRTRLSPWWAGLGDR